MAAIEISKLPPAPPYTGSGVPKGTDLTPATDITDPTATPTGTTKKYTRSSEFNYQMIALGFTTFQACKVASTLPFTAIYDNGASGIGATLTNDGVLAPFSADGKTLLVNDRVLIRAQASTLQNGIYRVVAAGDNATPWVLERASDYNTSANLSLTNVILVNEGNTYQGVCFQLKTPPPYSIGSTDLIFSPFSISHDTFPWNKVSNSVTATVMAPNSGYITSNNTDRTLVKLPQASKYGDIIAISGEGAGGFKIEQFNGQKIVYGAYSSLPGAAGFLISSLPSDQVLLVCQEDNTIWSVLSGTQGNIGIETGSGTVYNNALNAPFPLSPENGGTGLSSPAANKVLITNDTNVFIPITLNDGELLIGSSSGAPVANTLTAGSGIHITNASGNITIEADSSEAWNIVTTSTYPMSPNLGYTCDLAASVVTLTIPALISAGGWVEVNCNSSIGWIIGLNSGQKILWGSYSSTVGTSGGMASTLPTDTVRLRCIKENEIFLVSSSSGNITLI